MLKILAGMPHRFADLLAPKANSARAVQRAAK
jgi:hypothetical protein